MISPLSPRLLLRPPDCRIRRFAVATLSAVPTVSAVRQLLSIYANDAITEVRVESLKSIARLVLPLMLADQDASDELGGCITSIRCSTAAGDPKLGNAVSRCVALFNSHQWVTSNKARARLVTIWQRRSRRRRWEMWLLTTLAVLCTVEGIWYSQAWLRYLLGWTGAVTIWAMTSFYREHQSAINLLWALRPTTDAPPAEELRAFLLGSQAPFRIVREAWMAGLALIWLSTNGWSMLSWLAGSG